MNKHLNKSEKCKLDPQKLIAIASITANPDQPVMTLRRRDVPGLCYPVEDVCITNTKYLPNQLDDDSTNSTTNTKDLTKNNTKVSEESNDNKTTSKSQDNAVANETKIFSIFLIMVITVLLIMMFCNGIRHSSSMIVDAYSSSNNIILGNQMTTKNPSHYQQTSSLETLIRPRVKRWICNTAKRKAKLQAQNQLEMDKTIDPQPDSDVIQMASSQKSRVSDQDRDEFLANQENHYRGRNLQKASQAHRSEPQRNHRQPPRWSQPMSSQEIGDRAPNQRGPELLDTHASHRPQPIKQVSDIEDGDYDDESPTVADASSSNVPERRRLVNEAHHSGGETNDPKSNWPSRNSNQVSNNVDDNELNDDYNAANDDSHFARKPERSARKGSKKNKNDNDLRSDSLESQDRRMTQKRKSAYVRNIPNYQSEDEDQSNESSPNEALRSAPDDDSLYPGASESEASSSGNTGDGPQRSRGPQRFSIPVREYEEADRDGNPNEESNDGDEKASTTHQITNPDVGDFYNWRPNQASTSRQQRNAIAYSDTKQAKSQTVTPTTVNPEPYKAPISYSPQWNSEPKVVPILNGFKKVETNPQLLNNQVKVSIGQTYSTKINQNINPENVPYNPQNNPSHAGKYFIN